VLVVGSIVVLVVGSIVVLVVGSKVVVVGSRVVLVVGSRVVLVVGDAVVLVVGHESEFNKYIICPLLLVLTAYSIGAQPPSPPIFIATYCGPVVTADVSPILL
jgi:hypothetical protein